MKRIELHAKTKYSMDHESTIDIKNLILKSVANEEKGIAIVDRNSITSFYKAEKVIKDLNIKDFKLIYGVELEVSRYDSKYNVVVLLKNKESFKALCEILSIYKNITLSTLMEYKENFIIGLMYNSKNYNDKILRYFDYIEVDKNVSLSDINYFKKKTIVIYSNRINALSNEEKLAKKVLYSKLRIKNKVDNRVYQTTEEVLNEVNDKEIVIDNPNKIFNMVENFYLLDDEMIIPVNNDYDLDFLVCEKLKEKFGIDVLDINLNKSDIDIKINEDFGNSKQKKIIKRVINELKLIHDFKYEDLIYIYISIINKCKKNKEDYVICDYINYLYIAYLLGITHFDPLKYNLNSDIFFSNQPNISIKVSNDFYEEIDKFIKEELYLNTIKCKGLIKLNGIGLERTIESYEKKNKINFSLEERVVINKYLDNYPLSDRAIMFKQLILPFDYNYLDITPYCYINENIKCTNIDYKDIEDKFISIEIIPSMDITMLNELKEITGVNLNGHNYKDGKIIENEEFKSYLKYYDNKLILDDLYEDLINSNIELPDVFNIINEIRKDKVVCKNTKELLLKNNIKLKKYHDIKFISRGILNETTRLEYELLYFKQYYPLDYYYVMLKEYSVEFLIDMLKKEEKDIKKYPEYSSEYRCFYLIKEMKKIDIDFDIEERILVEDYCYELDKENNRIVLVINKKNSKIDKYLSNNLSLIGTRPINGKMQYLSKMICELLEKNKSITLFGLGGPISYYTEYLLSEITSLDRKGIHQYLNPVSNGIDGILDINCNQLFEGVRYLLNNDITITDYHTLSDSIIENTKTLLDKIIYFINNSESEIIIIDNLDVISKNLEDVLKKIRNVCINKNVIIFNNLKKEWERNKVNNITSFENYEILNKYINYVNILDNEEIYEVKE